MGYVAYLKWGSRTLNLADSTYWLMDFTPPVASYALNIAGGTSANRMGGGEVVGSSAADRNWQVAVRISGLSDAETHFAADRLAMFLALAHDKRHTLYLCYKPNDNYSYEPLWGQYGGCLRWEIKHGSLPPDQRIPYGVSSIRTKAMGVIMDLMIGPFALGVDQQLVASATGGVYEDIVGMTRAGTRGTIAAESMTNYFTNPIFGHAVPITGWTINANLVYAINYDPEFALWGGRSLRLTSIGSTNNYAYQSINVGVTSTVTISCYVKLPDGSAPTASICRLNYGGLQTTRYIPCGDGWYRMVASMAGVNANTDSGVWVGNGFTVYVTGFQLERPDYPTPFCCGDLNGSYWSGTAHESTSQRTAVKLTLSTAAIMLASAGTVRVVWKSDSNSSARTSTPNLFNNGALALAYNVATSKWVLTDGVNSATESGTHTFSENGTLHVFHAVYGIAEGLKLYLNGTLIASSATYTPFNPATAATMFIGSNTTPANAINGTFMGFATFDRSMTAAEIAAEYTNINEWITSGDGLGKKLETIPWVWSINGDNIIHSYSDTTHRDYAILHGIPGDAPADTVFHVTLSAGGRDLILCNNAYHDFADPLYTFKDLSGTPLAGAMGSEVEQSAPFTITEELIPGLTAIVLQSGQDAYLGKYCSILASMRDLGAGLRLRSILYVGATKHADVEYETVTSDTNLRQYLIGQIQVPETPNGKYSFLHPSWLTWYIGATRTGSSAYVATDWYRLLAGDLLYAGVTASLTTDLVIDSDGATGFINDVDMYGNSYLRKNEDIELSGDRIDLMPERYNHLIVQTGDDEAQVVLAATATLTRILVTPRYNLM